MNNQDFIIKSMETLKAVKQTFVDAGIPYDSDEEMREEIFILADFLQNAKMTKNHLVRTVEDVVDEFELRASHLTEEGRQFLIGPVFVKFQRAKLKNKLKTLQRALEQFRSLNSRADGPSP